jgi:hypothetical protein
MRREGYDEIMFSESGYFGWRDDELKNQLLENFRFEDLRGKILVAVGNFQRRNVLVPEFL